MMTIDELQNGRKELSDRITHLHEFLKIEERTEELASHEAKMSAPDFWNDKESAQATVAALSSCRNVLEPFRKLESAIEDYAAMLELAAEDEDFLSSYQILW